MASDRDTLTNLIEDSGLNLDRDPYVELWTEGEKELHRRPDWPSFEHRAAAMQEYRREKLAAAILEAGWRAPAQQITDPTVLDALPAGSVILTAGQAWQSIRTPAGPLWRLAGGVSDRSSLYVLRVFGPAIVLYTPTDITERPTE